VDAGAGAVEGEFADGDAHAAGAEIAEAQNTFVIRRDNQADVARSDVGEDFFDTAAMFGANPDAASPAVDMAVALTGQSDRRRINDRQTFLEMVEQHAIEERFVAILQGDQADVAFEGIGFRRNVLIGALGLHIESGHTRRQ